MDSNEEAILISQAKTDNRAFITLYDLHYQKIFSYVFRRTLDIELTRDIVSETFIKAYLNIRNYQYRNLPFAAWLYRIAGNEVNMFARKKRLRTIPLNETFDTTDTAIYDAEKKELELQQNKDFVEVQQKLKQLDSKYQEVIALRFFEGKPIHEIAGILNKKEGTVKSLLSRAIDKLRKMF